MNLREAIDKSEHSQNEVARQLGLDCATLCRYAQGTRNPGLEERLKINKYFGEMVLPIDKKTAELCQSINGLIGKDYPYPEVVVERSATKISDHQWVIDIARANSGRHKVDWGLFDTDVRYRSIIAKKLSKIKEKKKLSKIKEKKKREVATRVTKRDMFIALADHIGLEVKPSWGIDSIAAKITNALTPTQARPAPTMPPRLLEVLRLRLLDNLTLKQCQEPMGGISRERVRQLQQEAISWVMPFLGKED